MTTTHKRKRCMLKVLALVLPLSGMWMLASGGYIHAKAVLAQYLLEAAWTESLLGQKEVKPWPWADTWPVARLEVPGLGISRIVLAGANGSSLAFGPGRLFNPIHNDESGNTMIAGHRDTHFRFIKDLRRGDQIELRTTDGAKHSFVIRETLIVSEEDRSYLQFNGEKRLTLITCYPFDALEPGSSLRYLVLASPRPVLTRT